LSATDDQFSMRDSAIYHSIEANIWKAKPV
jgi:hypothetical protein